MLSFVYILIFCLFYLRPSNLALRLHIERLQGQDSARGGLNADETRHGHTSYFQVLCSESIFAAQIMLTSSQTLGHFEGRA
jgi:hypothetical protein